MSNEPEHSCGHTSAGFPTPGERARTVLHNAPTLVLADLGSCSTNGFVTAATLDDDAETLVIFHAADPNGTPLMLVDDNSSLVRIARRNGDVGCVLHGSSLTPASVADRVRAAIRMIGWLREVSETERTSAASLLAERGIDAAPPGMSLMCLDVAEVSVIDGRGHCDVDLDDYNDARPDMIADYETLIIGALTSDHLVEVALLGRLASYVVEAPCANAIVVGVDRFGVRVRVDVIYDMNTTQSVDVHLPFASPLQHSGQVSGAIASLVENARHVCCNDHQSCVKRLAR